jgi:hypothetical protein
MGVPVFARTTSLSVLARLALMGGGPPLPDKDGEGGALLPAADALLARALTTGFGPPLPLVEALSDEVDVSNLGFLMGVGVVASSSA